jgi:transcriptional regulator with XRE-family HTH domain
MHDTHIVKLYSSQFAAGILMHNLCVTDIGTQLKALREKRGWTITKLAAMAGVDQSTLSRAERNHTMLTQENLYKVCGCLGISVGALYDPGGNVVEEAADFRVIPVLDARGRESGETVSTRLDSPPHAFGMRILDDSMGPKFRQGDMVIIDPNEPWLPGDYVVARDSAGVAHFRLYRDAGLDASSNTLFRLVANNPDYGPMRSDRQKLTILGTMIEHHTYRRRR